MKFENVALKVMSKKEKARYERMPGDVQKAYRDFIGLSMLSVIVVLLGVIVDCVVSGAFLVFAIVLCGFMSVALIRFRKPNAWIRADKLEAKKRGS